MSEPRWRRRAEARPDEILDAALIAFEEKGFDAARIEDIAKTAGLSKGAVYLYFESKEQMLRALIERQVRPIVDAFEAAALAHFENPRQALIEFYQIVARQGFVRNAFVVPRIVISLAGRFPELSKYYHDTVVSRGAAVLERLVAHGVELGHFRAVDPRAVTRALVGPVVFVALNSSLCGTEPIGDIEGLARDQVNLLLQGLERS